MVVNPVVTPTISISTGTTTICSGSSVTFIATVSNGGSSPIYIWKLNGATVGTNTATYTNSSLANGDAITCAITSNVACATIPTVLSNPIAMTVNPILTPGLSITSSANTVCPGASITFTATPVNGGATPVFSWKLNGATVGTNSLTYTSTFNNNDIVTCEMTSSIACPIPSNLALSNPIAVNVIGASTVSIASSNNPVCSGMGVTFTATPTNAGTNASFQWKLNGTNVGTNSATYSNSALNNNDVVSCVYTSTSLCPSTATLGTGTTVNASNNNSGAFFPTFNGNGRQQYLIRITDLNAAGIFAGNLTSIGVNVSSSTVGSPATLNNYTIKLGNTASTATNTTFLNPTFTTVYGPSNYTPAVSSINTMNFTAPYYWNGTSNLLIEICFANQVAGTTAYRNTYSTFAYNAATFYQVNGATSTVCSQATGSNTTRRPNFIFNLLPVTTATSNSITMGINAIVTPAISIAVNSGGNPSCIGSNVSFTATSTNGGASPSFQWKVNGNNVGANLPSYSSSTLNNNDIVSCILTSNASCISSTNATSNAITIIRNSCGATLQAKLFIEGYYNGGGLMKPTKMNQGIGTNSSIVDDVTVELRNPNSGINPLGLIASNIATLNTDGTLSTTFTGINGNYFIVIKHKNSLSTWSNAPIAIANGTITYDFSNAINKAFGSNMIQLESNVYGIYSGDINQDGAIDNADFSMWEIDATLFNTGYLATDLDGGGSVDNGDFSIWELNSALFIAEVTP
jgi:hypothetical protein